MASVSIFENVSFIIGCLRCLCRREKWIDINFIMVGIGQQIQQKEEKKKLKTRIEELQGSDRTESLKLLKKLGYRE